MRFTLFCLVLLAAACTSDSDNGMLVNPEPLDDDQEQTQEIRFSTDVQPVFAASCAGSGCHIGASASGVNLASWPATMGSQGVQYGGPTVIAGNSSASPLIDKFRSSPRFGSRMPLGRAALPASSIQAIADWIDAGALDN